MTVCDGELETPNAEGARRQSENRSPEHPRAMEAVARVRLYFANSISLMPNVTATEACGFDPAALAARTGEQTVSAQLAVEREERKSKASLPRRRRSQGSAATPIVAASDSISSVAEVGKERIRLCDSSVRPRAAPHQLQRPGGVTGLLPGEPCRTGVRSLQRRTVAVGASPAIGQCAAGIAADDGAARGGSLRTSVRRRR